MAASLILAAALMGAPAAAADPAPVVAAERAFAADGATMGVRDSFVKHSVPDAVMIAAAPTTVSALYGAQPPGKPKDEPLLAWWPAFAGISRSGDFGFTTGPVEVGGQRTGHYFTVWKRQPDGGWKWIYDGGTNAPSKGEPPASVDPVLLPAAASHAASPKAAWDEVAAAEAALAKDAAGDHRAAMTARLAEGARLYVSKQPPARTSEGYASALAAAPAKIAFTPLGGEAAPGADLVWTYGRAVSDAGRGHYVHVWQRREAGWKLVFAQVIPPPPPPKPPQS